jgi:hypothetical protein
VATSKEIQKTHGEPSTPSIPGLAGEKVSDLDRQPSAQSLRMLDWLVKRSRRNAGVPFAQEFVRRSQDADLSKPAPPLARLLRGGKGGEVRLKFYLTMSLLAVSPPYDIGTPIPARAWAEALDLPDPGRNGARRVNDAIDWLAEHKFIVSERRQGTPGALRLLSQSGTGQPYTRPSGAARYVQMPLGVWRQGWIVRLSGTALAMLVILLDLQSGRPGPQWVSPLQAKLRYDLSADTWTKGTHELAQIGLLAVSKKPQGDFFDYRRTRNAYWVNEELFQDARDTQSPGSPGPRRTGSRSQRLGHRTHVEAAPANRETQPAPPSRQNLERPSQGPS